MGGVRGGTILYCTPPNLPLWGGTLENKVHQKTVFVRFGFLNFRPYKVGKNWIASGFCPRNNKKDFRANWTIKYNYLEIFVSIFVSILYFCIKKGFKLKPETLFNSETERFELSVQVTPHNTLAGCRLKPTRPRFLSDLLIIT